MKARRLAVIDEYVEDGEVVVFVNGQVVALSALATVAFFAVGKAWTEAIQVAAALIATFDEPPIGTDAMVTTRSVLRSLADLRLVELQ